MSRSGYGDDGDQWTLIKWRGQVASAIRGKRGQVFLRDLAQAMDEMPEKKLISEDLQNDEGVCAIGSLGARRGIDMTLVNPEDHRSLGSLFDIAHQLVAEVEFKNDENTWPNETPEQRWVRMREWVRGNIRD